MSDERRQFTRVPFHIIAAVEFQGEIVEGRVSDLSMKGLFVTTQRSVPEGEFVAVTLRMPDTNPPLEFRLRALVVREIPAGIGLQICESEIQSFTHLRNIVAMQSDDPDRVLEEFLPEK